jgi:hypothetical protein
VYELAGVIDWIVTRSAVIADQHKQALLGTDEY